MLKVDTTLYNIYYIIKYCNIYHQYSGAARERVGAYTWAVA